ncbi:MAG TPA: NfeD family protein [Vicinamibacterales bacterium]|nr:NfeD family protein [Vicinamibacterales bacterium]
MLVTAARLRRRSGAGATSLDERNGWRRLSALARGSSWRAITASIVLLTGLATVGLPSAQTPRPLVYVVPIEGMIDLGVAPFLARTIQEAEQAGAAAVVLDINTLGGRVDAAIVMRDALLQARVRTIAFVNPRAISAGALLALATETIVMTSGGTIGTAMPVVGGGSAPQAADEKSVSYLRKEFAATAERRGRPAKFAEAMVDVDVEIPGVVAKGKLLTLTASEAMDHRVVEFKADSLESALDATGLSAAEVRQTSQTWAETLVRFLTNPILASVLMTVGLLGILVEIRTPGFGIPGVIGLLSFAVLFWGHWIVQLAGWEELLLVAAGTLLIAAEVFVIPGFGVAGIAGIVALVAGLGMTLVGEGATTSIVIGALGRVAVSVLFAIGGALVLLRVLPHLPYGRQFVLNEDMNAGLGYATAPETDRSWLGRTGTAVSPLRPAGIAEIAGTRLDVVSDGGFIEALTVIEVTRVDGNRIVVRRRHAA